jgi:hypothetical protein
MVLGMVVERESRPCPREIRISDLAWPTGHVHVDDCLPLVAVRGRAGLGMVALG